MITSVLHRWRALAAASVLGSALVLAGCGGSDGVGSGGTGTFASGTITGFGSIIVNGSLVGYNEYAQKMHFGFEPPQQALWLTHPTRGLTFQEAVFADDPKPQTEREWVSVHRA